MSELRYIIAGKNCAFNSDRLYWTGFDCPHWSKNQSDAQRFSKDKVLTLVRLLRDSEFNVAVVSLVRRKKH